MDKTISIYKEIKNILIDLINEDGYKDNSQAFGALFIRNYFGLQDADIKDLITDGFGDNGIDAVYVDDNSTLHLLQFKFPEKSIDKASKEDDISSFISGAKCFIGSDSEFALRNWNEKLLAKREIVKKLTLKGTILHFVSFSRQIPTSIESYKESINEYSKRENLNISFEYYSCEEICHLYICSQIKTWPNFKLKYKSYYFDNLDSSKKDNNSAIFYISLYDYYLAIKDLNGDIYEGNVRYFYEKSEVNSEIMSTLINEPENFYLLNNGVTIICQAFFHDKTNSLIDIRNGSIVNGAQTTQCILNAVSKVISDSGDIEPFKKSYVLVKAIQVSSDLELTNKIVYALNSQNRMPVSYFVSNDVNIHFLQHQFEINQAFFLEIKKNEYLKEKQKRVNQFLGEKVSVEALLQEYELFYDINHIPHIVANRKSVFFTKENIFPITKRISYEDAVHAHMMGISIKSVIRYYRRFCNGEESSFFGADKSQRAMVQKACSYLLYSKSLLLYGAGCLERLLNRELSLKEIDRFVLYSRRHFNELGRDDLYNYLRTKTAFDEFKAFIVANADKMMSSPKDNEDNEKGSNS